jgi:hypothetical protein
MGSSGVGSFGDYKPKVVQTSSGTQMPVGGNDDPCNVPLENIRLEDVGQLDYYNNHSTVPQVGQPVQIRVTLVNGRIAVDTADTSEVIGNLPTKYHTIINCLNSGRRYEGSVVSSGLIPIPYVVVSLYAR